MRENGVFDLVQMLNPATKVLILDETSNIFMGNELSSENTGSSSWVKALKSAAVISFISGFMFLLFFVWDFARLVSPNEYSFYFNQQNGIEDLANVLLGSTGLMWSLTATFLFIYTIFQTRIQISMQQTEIRNQVNEMVTSNNTSKAQYDLLVKQQYRATFFNLLENHSRLMETIGYNDRQGHYGLNMLYNEIKPSVKNYYNGIFFKEFDDFGFSRDFPKYKYKDQKDSIELVTKSVCTIIRYIDNFLEGDNLFYELLNNHLSVAEKYLIGYYCNFYISTEVELLKAHNFKFLSYYNSSYLQQYNENNYVPSLNLKWFEMAGNTFHLGTTDTGQKFPGYFGFSIEVIHNEFKLPLKFHRIDIAVFNRGNKIFYKHHDFKPLNIEWGINFKFSEIDTLLESFIVEYKPSWEAELIFEATMLFTYNGIKYDYNKQFKFVCRPLGKMFAFTKKEL